MVINVEERNRDLAKDLQSARETYEKSIQTWGWEYYVEVIQPLERRYNLKYLAGNADVCFLDLNNNREIIRYDDVADNYRKGGDRFDAEMSDELMQVFDMLNYELSHADYFGYYV